MQKEYIMYELFATVQRGKHTIISIVVIIGIFLMAVRLLVRHIMKASAKSKRSKGA